MCPALDGDAKLVHWNASITPNQHALATGVRRVRSVLRFGRRLGRRLAMVDGRQRRPTSRRKRSRSCTPGADRTRTIGKERTAASTSSIETPARRRAENPTHAGRRRLDARRGRCRRGRSAARGRHRIPLGCRKSRRITRSELRVLHRRRALRVSEVPIPAAIAPVREPFKTKTRVAYATALGLASDTDPYFRGYDASFSGLLARARMAARARRIRTCRPTCPSSSSFVSRTITSARSRARSMASTRPTRRSPITTTRSGCSWKHCRGRGSGRTRSSSRSRTTRKTAPTTSTRTAACSSSPAGT